MEVYDLCEKLLRQRAFFYKIQDDLFLVGTYVFRPANQEECTIYEQYCVEMEAIHKIEYDLEFSDVQELKRLFDRLIDIADNPMFAPDKSVAVRLKNYLKKYSPNEIEQISINIQSQAKQMLEAMDYADNACYRHAKINHPDENIPKS